MGVLGIEQWRMHSCRAEGGVDENPEMAADHDLATPIAPHDLSTAFAPEKHLSFCCSVMSPLCSGTYVWCIVVGGLSVVRPADTFRTMQARGDQGGDVEGTRSVQ